MKEHSHVSREAENKLEEFYKLLVRWNKKINLVSEKSLTFLSRRHVVDSLQLLKYIPMKNIAIIDLGSGAGFPGIILSLCGIENITLVESDSRKAAFLLEASRLSSNKIEIINDRIENIKSLTCDIITSRAFSDLNSIFNYSRNIEARDKYLLHKGATYKEEVYHAQKHWLFNIVIHDSITSDDGKILEVTNLRQLNT